MSSNDNANIVRESMGRQHYSPARVIIAVSGTIQCGFELRSNIDFTTTNNSNSNNDNKDEDSVVKAIFLGYAVVRGVKMYFDIKDTMAREYDAEKPHRVNPAMVLTGDRLDANQYALYLVDERACLQALLGEPRMLTMTPDAVRIDLDDKDTSPEVSALAQAIIQKEGKSNLKQCAVMAVVSCYRLSTFVAAPPKEIRQDGTRLTSFKESLQKFANISSKNDVNECPAPGSDEWNRQVAEVLMETRTNHSTRKTSNVTSNKRQKKCKNDIAETPPPQPSSSVTLPTARATDSDQNNAIMVTDVELYGTDKHCARISQRMTAEEFNRFATGAGLKMRAT